MQSGFPLDLLHLLRCPTDGGELGALMGIAPYMVDGRVACLSCSREFSVSAGILSFLSEERLHPESAHEMRQRDAKNDSILQGVRAEWTSEIADAVEVVPTLQAVDVRPGMNVLELGCGAGRYTLALLDVASAVVAIDFSRVGLMLVRQKLASSARVALVQADVTVQYAAPGTFDRALSTLHSNLPDAHHRSACLGHVANALKDDGRAVISMHHDNLRARVSGLPAAGRYADSGIYRYYMRRAEALRESRPYFDRIRFIHLSAGIPGTRSVRLARLAARLPLSRSTLAQMFLAVSEGPRRPLPAVPTGGSSETGVPCVATSLAQRLGDSAVEAMGPRS